MGLQKLTRPFGVVSKRFRTTLPQKQLVETKPFEISPNLSYELTCSKTPRGILVASVETEAPVSRVLLGVRAGSRNEAAHEQGAAHALRALGFLSTRDATQFGISRTVDANGGFCQVTSTREATFYGAEVLRDKLPLAVDILDQIGTKHSFKPWEVQAAISGPLSLDVDAFNEDGGKVAVELAHAAAFRSGLGRSLYCPEFALKKLTPDILLDFVAATVTAPRVVVVGVGVNHEDLLDLCSKITVDDHPGRESLPSNFHRDQELRRDTPSGVASVALLYEGRPFGTRDALVLGVIQRILGAGPAVKYGIGSGRLAKRVAESGKNPALAAALNANYSDAGVFGVTLTSTPQDAGDIIKVVKETLDDVAGGNFSEQDVESGKKQLKTSLLMASELSNHVAEDLAIQALFGHPIQDLESVIKSIDDISMNDVKKISADILSSKPSMGACGNLGFVPYLDQL